MVYTTASPTRQIAEHSSLIDVTHTAARAGFTVPVTVTATIWTDTQRVPERWIGYQDAACRLWDLLLTSRQQLDVLPTEPTLLTVPMEIEGVRDYQVWATFHTTGEQRGSITISRHDEL